MFYCKNIFKLSSKYSETPICDFIVKFLGKETNRLCDEENVVCSDCLTKIDEYDWACLTVERVERELRATLLQTEAAYTSDPVFLEILDRELDEEELLGDDCSKMPLLQIEFATTEPTEKENEANCDKKSARGKRVVSKRKSHLATVGGDEKRLSKIKDELNCSQCSEEFTSRAELKQHEKSHMKNGLFSCELCSLTTKTAAGLRRHKQLHANGEPFECAICKKVFKKKNSVARHMRIHVSIDETA